MSAIFSELDKVNYFGDLTAKVEPQALDSAIRQAVILAESPEGAGRELGVKTFVDTRSVPSVGRLYLNHKPIVAPLTATVQMRGNSNALYGLFMQFDNQWRTLDADSYTLDAVTGELILTGIANNNYMVNGQGYGRSRPTRRYQSPSVKVTYQSGIDFTADSALTRRTKDVISSLVRVLVQNQAASTGLKSYALEGFYKADFDSESTSSVIASHLKVIKGLLS